MTEETPRLTSIRVAEALGFECRLVMSRTGMPAYQVFDQDGEAVADYRHVVGLAWWLAFEQYGSSRRLPRYAESDDAANRLLTGLRYTHEHCPTGLPHNDAVTDRVLILDLNRALGVGEATTPAQAKALAWLVYWEKSKGAQDGIHPDDGAS